MKECNAVIVSIAVAQGDKLEVISLNLPSHRIKQEMEDKDYQSSIFSDMLIFYENFVVLYWVMMVSVPLSGGIPGTWIKHLLLRLYIHECNVTMRNHRKVLQ